MIGCLYYVSMSIKPSLCCIHSGLQKSGAKFRVMTYTQFVKLGKKHGMIELANRSLNNIQTICKIVKVCGDKNWNYRIGSNVFPLMTHPKLNLKIQDFYNADQIFAEFKVAADLIKKLGVRCSMHPDQFVVPASPRPNVRDSAVKDLIQHAMIMDLLGLPKSYEAPINIHMNSYNDGDYVATANRFFGVYDNLPDNVRNRLVLENEDKLKSWTVEKLYEHIYTRSHVPITFDNHHFALNPGTQTIDQAFDMAISTWPKNISPLFHFSDGIVSVVDVKKNPRAHADLPYRIPQVYVDYKNSLHLDFEFKSKEIAIESGLKLFELYRVVA